MEKNIYMVELTEQLEINNEIETIDNKEGIYSSNVSVSVDVGKTKRTIKEIKEMQVGDYLVLNKLLDEGLSINVNNTLIGYGENMLLDGKLGVNIIKIGK